MAAAGAVTAIAAAVQQQYGVCAIALFAVAGSAFGTVLISRSQDAATNHAVLHGLQESPHQPIEALADDLGLRPAAVRLSLHRLAKTGVLPPAVDPAE
ncbi:hypothetical protein AAGT00_04790 [Streptomyces cavourensis]